MAPERFPFGDDHANLRVDRTHVFRLPLRLHAEGVAFGQKRRIAVAERLHGRSQTLRMAPERFPLGADQADLAVERGYLSRQTLCLQSEGIALGDQCGVEIGQISGVRIRAFRMAAKQLPLGNHRGDLRVEGLRLNRQPLRVFPEGLALANQSLHPRRQILNFPFEM